MYRRIWTGRGHLHRVKWVWCATPGSQVGVKIAARCGCWWVLVGGLWGLAWPCDQALKRPSDLPLGLSSLSPLPSLLLFRASISQCVQSERQPPIIHQYPTRRARPEAQDVSSAGDAMHEADPHLGGRARLLLEQVASDAEHQIPPHPPNRTGSCGIPAQPVDCMKN